LYVETNYHFINHPSFRKIKKLSVMIMPIQHKRFVKIIFKINIIVIKAFKSNFNIIIIDIRKFRMQKLPTE